MKSTGKKRELAPKEGEELLTALEVRFAKNMHRHEGFEWPKEQARLEAGPGKLWSVSEMEKTGGEPDVVETMKRRANTSFSTAQRRLPKAG